MIARVYAATSMSPVRSVRAVEVRASRGAIDAAGVNRPLVTSACLSGLLLGLLLLTRPSAALRRAAGRASRHLPGRTAGVN